LRIVNHPCHIYSTVSEVPRLDVFKATPSLVEKSVTYMRRSSTCRLTCFRGNLISQIIRATHRATPHLSLSHRFSIKDNMSELSAEDHGLLCCILYHARHDICEESLTNFAFCTLLHNLAKCCSFNLICCKVSYSDYYTCHPAVFPSFSIQ
jgi:hypothetical protein